MKPEKKYKYANIEYINELADGDNDFLAEVIQTFLNSIPVSLIKLKDAVDARDYKNVAFLAHKLKGSFAFIGCTQLNNTFTLVEQYCADEAKHAMIPEMIAEIASIYEMIAVELEDILTESRS